MIYDICVLGGGVAGLFSALRLSEKQSKPKVILIDMGRPQGKRRRQIDGFFGCLPAGDGKLYTSDIDKVSDIVSNKKAKKAAKYVKSIFKQFSTLKLVKDKGPSKLMRRRLNKNKYETMLNDYYQLYPKDIHALSKWMADTIELSPNIEFSFDNEIFSITKNKKIFTIQTEIGEVKCKKVIFCVGRSGWRFAHNIFKTFGLVESNDITKFGVCIEMPSNMLKDFNRSTCSLVKDDLEIGPLSWNGTIIPEDHTNMAIAAFRSNENRWKTDKASFYFIRNIYCENKGVEETTRLAELTHVLSDDRILKEKISMLINGKSKMSIIPDYEWIEKYIKDFSSIIPDILTKAHFHVPAIIPLPSQIKIGTNLSTELNGFYIAGESVGVIGIYAAAITGILAADSVCRS